MNSVFYSGASTDSPFAQNAGDARRRIRVQQEATILMNDCLTSQTVSSLSRLELAHDDLDLSLVAMSYSGDLDEKPFTLIDAPLLLLLLLHFLAKQRT